MIVKIIYSYLLFWGLWELLYNLTTVDGKIIRILIGVMRLSLFVVVPSLVWL